MTARRQARSTALAAELGLFMDRGSMQPRDLPSRPRTAAPEPGVDAVATKRQSRRQMQPLAPVASSWLTVQGSMLNDLRYALRSLVRSPLFTAGAVATLALGIGVNSTIFGLTNAMLFGSQPGIADPGALVWVNTAWRDRSRAGDLSYPDYVDYRNGSTSAFTDMLAFNPTPLSLAGNGPSERIRGQLVTGSYFGLLGVVPATGRLIDPIDDRPDVLRMVAVLSHRLWQRRFELSPDVLQRTIIINGRSFDIIGVAAAGFRGPELGESPDVWLPLALLPEVRTTDRGLLVERGSSWLHVMGRLRPDVSVPGAQSVLRTIAAQLEQDHPTTNEGRSVVVSAPGSSLSPQGRSEMVPLAILLQTITALVLLIACANVANLLLARGAGRSLEIGIRAALGASRTRQVRQLLTESAVLGLAGAAAGLLLSFWAGDLLVSVLPAADFDGLSSGADLRVLLFTTATATICVCTFGVVPAIVSTRRALVPVLRQTPSAGGRSRLQRILVVAQLSLSLVLLVAAGLSLRALQKSAAIDLGFTPAHVMTASYDLVLQNYPPDRRETFRRELLTRVAALPGVVSATLTNILPLSGTMTGNVVHSTTDAGDEVESRVYLNGVSQDYFRTLQIPIVRGREFTAADHRGSAAVALVNETLARRLWGQGAVEGRRLRLGERVLDVIGVARDAKYDEATEEPLPFMYLPVEQQALLDRETLVVRSAGAISGLAALIQGEIRILDPALPVFDVQPFESVLRQRADKQRGVSALLGAVGMLALVLAALGLYGVMTHSVTLRTREMGVRLALGATPAQVTAGVTGDALRLALTGVVVGSVLSLPLVQVLGVLVFGVQVGDLVPFVGTAALLTVVALAAAAIPARRAARLDPIATLRHE